MNSSEEGLPAVREYANAIAGAVATAIRGHLTPGISSNTSSERTGPTFNLATDVRSVAKRPKFSPPSLFENTRRCKSRKVNKYTTSPKMISYVRDVILLPMDYVNCDGEIYIPRCAKRNKLGKTGLIGKIEINSAMSDQHVREEICAVFSSPMGLLEDDLKNGRLFPFSYLQRAGTGSKSLCSPSVREGFEWSGRQVASLSKSGSFIYLLAKAKLVTWI